MHLLFSTALSSGRRRNRRSAVRSSGTTLWLILLWFLATAAAQSQPVELPPQRISLPTGANTSLFADIEGKGRCALLVIDPVAWTLLNYRQSPAGFSRTPDQVLPLPPQTLWVGVGEVDPHPGLELVFSTVTGMVYSRQNEGRFETEPRPLIATSQAFTNCDFPPLTLLATNQAGASVIPVIFPGKAVWYQRNSTGEWSPGPATVLNTNQTTWSLDQGGWSGSWSLGPNAAHRWRIQQSWRAKTNASPDEEAENETIRKIVVDLKKTARAALPRVEHLDVDGDGRQDVMVWQVSGYVDCKTDIYLFLRNADGQLPGQPTQVLHCRGFPLPLGPRGEWSPAQDLHGDGIDELVLFEFKTTVLSSSGLLDAALSHGLDWSVAIRSFHRGGFSHSPDASITVTAFLPGQVTGGWPFFFGGDFNGDGRPDLLVRRSDTQWNVFLSTTDGRWFAPQPALTFAVPAQGYIEIKDLNGDGRSDIIWHELNEPGLSIFMSPAHPAKDKNP